MLVFISGQKKSEIKKGGRMIISNDRGAADESTFLTLKHFLE